MNVYSKPWVPPHQGLLSSSRGHFGCDAQVLYTVTFALPRVSDWTDLVECQSRGPLSSFTFSIVTFFFKIRTSSLHSLCTVCGGTFSRKSAFPRFSRPRLTWIELVLTRSPTPKHIHHLYSFQFCHNIVTLALGKLSRSSSHAFEASLSYMVRLCLKNVKHQNAKKRQPLRRNKNNSRKKSKLDTYRTFYLELMQARFFTCDVHKDTAITQ